MIRLNLLSAKEKKYFTISRFMNIWREILWIILIFMLVNSIVLVGGRKLLQNQLGQYANDIPGAREIEKVNIDIRMANEWIAFHLGWHRYYISWLVPLLEIAKITPSSITLVSLNMSSDGTVAITGTADFRNDLIVFRDNLKNSDFLTEVDLPLQNLTASKNIIFSMRAKLKLDNLKLKL
ncbi:hypothetical protein A3B21_02525 [Candidatus Uhrbacteria bacterium RIFCSPLOWO2_01_FULL_47_24]|uniref:Uncharacterized protein n=1 Tax=Candidatus Uhrbacteria bacterium RIFCSPLOWO2_01_FULL_47_24 TaxID=1802401 RepID=A0A1F7UQP5_9BACT|nr:MAG: hypothetical protein A2753_02315 [Candidatus Uhrbacteria bacterium RIFCSPHIGHO2_01_FULL_47_11]OGL68280.1 MAG: hypothetical protein A3D58_04745 [Candidatus Uhrbacteria bacterium RIFCSPHIGHO2_02_FULL_46_47]OGL75692.1 MAG: hypothetical protein A3F52_01755 [Candidatus Uhrbacteria bacterium RIFCSPHIGHO2_12_FULL_47_11]OGL80018.1 MAG: hypothetical protein A3B21_02525 [Candidatus Uhrbacteria bacterium RIFCSPLOWO2_01_FULL_47_24]OGL85216.1 MAG: hypothetical protein A3J03_00115 [Candidatus Uhrbact